MEEEFKRKTKTEVDRAIVNLVAKFQDQNPFYLYQLPATLSYQLPILNQKLGVSGHSTQSGLEINTNARSATEQSNATIYPKELCGQTDRERLKRKKLVTTKLDVELGVNNAISILT